MEEKRKYPRTEVNEPAYISAGGSVMSCMVKNISEEGAAIDVENTAFVPPSFRLVIIGDFSSQGMPDSVVAAEPDWRELRQ